VKTVYQGINGKLYKHEIEGSTAIGVPPCQEDRPSYLISDEFFNIVMHWHNANLDQQVENLEDFVPEILQLLQKEGWQLDDSLEL
jgi:hypothetical protein